MEAKAEAGREVRDEVEGRDAEFDAEWDAERVERDVDARDVEDVEEEER
jgi:hypothetical protein